MKKRSTPEFDIIRDAGLRYAHQVRGAAQSALPESDRVLSGEVLEVWRSGDQWLLTLLDSKEELTLRATLPTIEARPRVGHTIGLVGRYVVELDEIDASVQLMFAARTRAAWYVENVSARITNRRLLLDKLQGEFPERAWLAAPPRRVALVTSGASASLQDFEAGLTDCSDAVVKEEDFVPLEKSTPLEIAAGILRAAERSPDLIVVMRGGGRKVMLHRFSDPAVVRAVADVGTTIPIIVAVGHERDRVDAEHFAWRRASTPYAAGAIVASEIRKHRWKEKRRASIAQGDARSQRPRDDASSPAAARRPVVASVIAASMTNTDTAPPPPRARKPRRWLALLWVGGVVAGVVGGWIARGTEDVGPDLGRSTRASPSREAAPPPSLQSPDNAAHPPYHRRKQGPRRAGADGADEPTTKTPMPALRAP